jgi:hypothetical protein
VILPPKLQEIDAAILDVFIELVVVLAILDELIAGSIKPHEGIDSRALETRDLAYKSAVEAVVHIFILFLFDEPALQGQHLAVLFCIEQHVEVESDPAVLPSYNIVGLIVEYFLVFFPVLRGVITIGFGAHHDQWEAIDPYGEAHVQGIAAGDAFNGDLDGMPAEIGEKDGVAGRQYDAVMARAIRGGTGPGRA